MHQRGVVGFAQEFHQVGCRLDVAGERIAQVGIEVREAATVHDHIDRTCQALARHGVQSQSRFADVAFDDFEFLA